MAFKTCIFLVILLLNYCYQDVLNSDSTRRGSQDICPPISQIKIKNFTKICLIIKKCPEDVLIKLPIVLKISKSS